jgi:hypothetical protein
MKLRFAVPRNITTDDDDGDDGGGGVGGGDYESLHRLITQSLLVAARHLVGRKVTWWPDCESSVK